MWHPDRVTAKRAAAVAEPEATKPARIQGSPRVGPDQIAALAARVVTAGPRVRVPVTMPFTGEPLGEVPRGKPEDVRAAFERAWRAQPEWAETPLAERVKPFLRYHDLLLDRQDEVLDLIQLENGKSRLHAYEEVVDGALISRHYAHHAASYLEPVRRKGVVPGLTYTYEHRQPKGVVGIISPWNFPLVLSMSDAIPALIAGNAVVMKPDLQAPFTALWAAALLEECGLSHDLLLIVTGEGPELGPELIAHSDYLAFTGSTATGRRVAAQAAERLVGCSLELGGKNPMLVLADADVEAAARGAVRGCFAGAGQVCVSIERLYVHESLYHRFLKLFVDETQAVRLGASLDYTYNIGSLASAAQLRKIEEHVRDAVGKGAIVAAGGRARPDLGPYFYEPTILTGVTPEMRLYAEETFGPVVAVYKFDTANEAIERANATPYGLNASVWTRDTAKGRRLATRIQAGTVNVNEAYGATWGSVDAPMGGFKESGLGRRHGAEGMLRYTEAQTIAIQRGMALAPPPGMSDETFAKTFTAGLKALKRTPGLR
jgi:succinate-semialdehyde dehydrogenase/glutarate-semialdehyde dehydrogenase